MEQSAITFAFLGIVLDCCQLSMIGPNQRCDSNQACIHGEDLAKQAAAISKNTVVGKPGTTIPTTPSAIKKSPAKIRKYLTTALDNRENSSHRALSLVHFGNLSSSRQYYISAMYNF